ncbi:unnamed protein product [Lymnaea stagnalis]|uniref:G-protein coupled receptors family 1 profile domain-containing protein n=1 Tax=Lymnaea stagnalis TaxID=6523 RepID=A0AAV2HZB4_LYMST
MLTTFSLCGAIGNGLVAYVYTHKAKKDSATIFILALSCTDLLACLVTMPYTAVTEYLQHKLNYDLACKLYTFMITFNVPLSAFLMVVISLDR